MNDGIDSLPDLDRDAYKPLYVQLSGVLLQAIKSNQFKPGDNLPSENKLIKRFGISRQTVRIAMQRLSAEGLVYSIQGKGTFVAQPRLVTDYSRMRSLEKEFPGQGITNKILFDGMESPPKTYLEALGLPEKKQVLKIHRLKMIKDVPFALELRYLPLDISNRFSLEAIKTTPLIELFDTTAHTKIKRVDFRVKAAILAPGEAATLSVPVGTPALVQHSTHYNLSEQPIATGRITFRFDTIEILFSIQNEAQIYKELINSTQ